MYFLKWIFFQVQLSKANTWWNSRGEPDVNAFQTVSKSAWTCHSLDWYLHCIHVHVGFSLISYYIFDGLPSSWEYFTKLFLASKFFNLVVPLHSSWSDDIRWCGSPHCIFGHNSPKAVLYFSRCVKRKCIFGRQQNLRKYVIQYFGRAICILLSQLTSGSAHCIFIACYWGSCEINNTITDGGSTAPLYCWYQTEEKTI